MLRHAEAQKTYATQAPSTRIFNLPIQTARSKLYDTSFVIQNPATQTLSTVYVTKALSTRIYVIYQSKLFDPNFGCRPYGPNFTHTVKTPHICMDIVYSIVCAYV